jgi:hypothetical protein
MLNDLQFQLSFYAGLFPKIYYPLFAGKYPFNQLAVTSSTEICIEGYPRCANSFAAYAFLLSNGDVKIGHHLHVPAQILRAVSMNIPAVAVIRNPEDAVLSFLVFQHSVNADLYLKAYIKFYESIIHLSDKFIITDFSTTIGDFNKVIRSVNSKFNTEFKTIENLDQRKDEIFATLKQINDKFFKGDKNKIMYPDETRDKQKELMRKYTKESKYLSKANEVYKNFITNSL